VVYGARQHPLAVAVSPKELNRILQSRSGHNTIFNVDIAGTENTPVMIVDWQNDPIKVEPAPCGPESESTSTNGSKSECRWHTTGEPKGVKQQDGLLELVVREVEIECLPDEIPEEFIIDVTELMLGQSSRAGEIPLSGSMKLVSPADSVIAHVIA